MMHSTGSSMEKWSTQILPRLAVCAHNLTYTMGRLARIRIKNPGACLVRIAKELRLPREIAEEVGEELDNTLTSASAFDVYAWIFEIFEKNAKKKGIEYSLSQKFKNEEIATKAIFLNFSDYDLPLPAATKKAFKAA